MAATWLCVRCRRRVPSYVEVCHCGSARAEASSAAAPAGTAPARHEARRLPWQVWLAIGVMGVALLAGAISLFFVPRRPQATVPLLGYVDRLPSAAPRPSPSLRPSPSPSARAPR